MRSRLVRLPVWAAIVSCSFIGGCSGARNDSIGRSLGRGDAGPASDAALDAVTSTTPDTASGDDDVDDAPGLDASVSAEDSAVEDAGDADAGSSQDADGFEDAGSLDASGLADTSVPDAGVTEASVADAGPSDASTGDAGPSCIDSDATTDAGCLVRLPLFGTGLGSDGVVLAGGSVDPHYTLVQSADTTFTGPAAIVVSAIAAGYWLPQSASSAWIAPSANQVYPGASPCNAAGNYVYRTSFDLSGYEPTSAKIAGGWAADNAGIDVRLNGVSLGLTAPSYTPLTPFMIESGFVAGANTLEFEISDYGCPNGLRVEISGTALLAR